MIHDIYDYNMADILVEGAIIALSLDGPGWFIWSIYNTTQVLVRLGKTHTNRWLILKNDEYR